MRGFDVLDLIFLAIIVLGGMNGYRLGVVRQVTRLFGAVIAYFVSYWLRPYVAPVIQNLHLFSQSKQSTAVDFIMGDLSGALAFGLVFVVTFLLLRYAAGLLDALFRLPVLSFLNRMVGLVAGVALAVVFVFVVALILHYINTPWIQSQMSHSGLAHWITAGRFQTPDVSKVLSRTA
ncbi:CvpA family protein [Alicyclobacillus fastidiosus]|uniref:CvpA family protein n=1 Tax=Alicyclobacillus fastidiosus TaxID=392011 RepID=A0ABV5AIW0_9BACL|nr:CvpA family protein [Alicyclobacillus fastidiosus]WEH11187.1 CvpA family protein [Alicyclobacillus fastidiosus]